MFCQQLLRFCCTGCLEQGEGASVEAEAFEVQAGQGADIGVIVGNQDMSGRSISVR